MAKKYYFPDDDGGRADWFENLSSKIDTYKTKYGLTVAEVNFIKALALYFRFWYSQVAQLKATIKSIVSFKREILNGPGDGTDSAAPADISFAAAPPAVPHGILKELRSIINRIKKHTGYTITDGDDLKIEGAEPEEEETLKPAIKIKIKDGHPEIIWKKGEAGALLIRVNRNIGNTPIPIPTPSPETFEFLAIDTIPNYADTHPLPPFGQSQVWGYRCRYMINDEEVGDWSDIVTIAVSGDV
jgi:hypothetical protein